MTTPTRLTTWVRRIAVVAATTGTVKAAQAPVAGSMRVALEESWLTSHTMPDESSPTPVLPRPGRAVGVPVPKMRMPPPVSASKMVRRLIGSDATMPPPGVNRMRRAA